MINIIGLTGYKQAGKNTFSAVLKREAALKYGLDKVRVHEFSLGEYLKEALAELYEVPVSKIDQSKHELLGRWILQQVGTEYFRKFHGEDFFVEIVWDKILKLYHQTNHDHIVIIPDLRFVSEFEFLKHEIDGNRSKLTIVNVVKTHKDFDHTEYNCSDGLRATYLALDNHQSEVEHLKIPYDYQVINDAPRVEDYENTCLVTVNKILNSYGLPSTHK